MATKKSIVLLIIDPQRSFCDGTLSELYVPESESAIDRLAAFVGRHGRHLDDIDVTLDSHHQLHIAHGLFWRDQAGAQPPPFTVIGADDVTAGRWVPRVQVRVRLGTGEVSSRDYAAHYLTTLAATGRYPHRIWPQHCRIMSAGCEVMPALRKSLFDWEDRFVGMVGKHTKGSCIWSEHFGAVKAEVPYPGDPATQLNIDLVRKLEQADTILVAGWATNFCVANTVRDIAAAFASPDHVGKFVLLTDCTNQVVGNGCEALTDTFLAEFAGTPGKPGKGMRLATSVDVL